MTGDSPSTTRPVSLVLGPGGERSWKVLLRSYVLQQRLGRAIVVSADAEIHKEARARFEQVAPEVRLIRPSDDVLEHIDALAQEHQDSARLPVAWIEGAGDSPDSPRWAAALRRLNAGRQHLDREGPVFVIIAGPTELARRVMRYPDLWSVIRVFRELGDTATPLRNTSMRPFTWLHLSDLHVAETSDWRADVVQAHFLRDLPALLRSAGFCSAEAEATLDAVFVTGDVAAAGQRLEFDQAGELLTAVCTAVGVSPTQRLFIAPGNHDVDRNQVKRPARKEQEALRAQVDRIKFQDELSEILDESMDVHTPRLATFADFTERLLGLARAYAPDSLWRLDTLDHDGLTLGVATLSSAWLCGPDKQADAQPILGERPLQDAITALQGHDLRLALVHHPLDALLDADRRVVEPLAQSGLHLLLHGHTHEAENLKVDDGSTTHLPRGADARGTGSRGRRGFQAGRLNPATGEVEVHHFTYDGRSGGRWLPDSGATRSGPVARWSLPPVAIAPTPVAASSPKQRDNLRQRICKSAEAVHGRLRIIGIALYSEHQSARLRDLFIPPNLMTGGAPQPLAELESQWIAGDRRAVVLGDPGSGKTTLAQHLALEAARGEVVPLLIRLRDYVRQPDRPSWLAFAAQQIARQLSVSVTEQALEDLCVQGQAILIIDGMDEVGHASARATISEQIAGFASAHPKASVVATSRVVGYGAAELAPKVFSHHTLAPFDAAQLRDFVTHWMEMVEPDDPAARRQSRDKLLAALAAEPRAQALARNPLLATLIALVHRQDASLPGERAILYDKVVELLVRTRLHAKEQRFEGITEDIQIALLGKLALHMQRGRGDDDEGVTISRRDLTTTLTDLISLRGISSPKRTAETWVEWLCARTGVIVEQSAGVFGFLHLSLLEYLAGQALDTELRSAGGDLAVANFIVEHLDASWWRETLLLIAGARATDKALVDALFGALKLGLWQHLEFCMALMREEVDFSDQQRGTILEAAAAMLRHQRGAPELIDLRRLVRDLPRFGKRHGAALRHWLGPQLEGLLAAAIAEGAQRPGRLLGLVAQGVADFGQHVDSEDLKTRATAAIVAAFEPGPCAWPLDDRLLALEALGQPTMDDPRLAEDLWVDIPGGSFTFGADQEAEGVLAPRHESVPAFRMAWRPVTVRDYAPFVDDGGYTEDPWWEQEGEHPWRSPLDWSSQLFHGNRPVVGVSWHEARAFCRWASQRWGCEVSLPTEVQWEFAAAGAEGRVFPWGREDETVATEILSQWDTAPVGAVPRGACRAYERPLEDLASSVGEWCSDAWQTPNQDPRERGYRVVRGRSFIGSTKLRRCADRFGIPPEFRDRELGFRVVCRLPPVP